MVLACCVLTCTSTFVKDGPIKFLRFPKDEKRRKQWEAALQRVNFKVTDYTRICTKHFSEDCFDRERFGIGTFLKKDAVPTIFERTEDPFEKKPRLCYLGDFKPEHLNSASTARRLLTVSKEKLIEKQFEIDKLKRLNRSLEKKVLSLTSVTTDEKVAEKQLEIDKLKKHNKYLKKRVSSLKKVISELQKKSPTSSEVSELSLPDDCQTSS